MTIKNLFENQPVYKSKRSLLDDTYTKRSKIISKSDYICSYNYHGIILNFYGSNKEFVQKIVTFLPDSWTCLNEETALSSLNIYLENRWESSWDLEENPDCEIRYENDFEMAIQRDFIGVDDRSTNIIISIDSIHADGIFNAMRWFLPRRMIKHGLFLLHSSCVVDNGEAYFFLGASGAGKSTIASLSGDRIVLGDDMNIMKIVDGQVFARAGGLGGMSFESTDFDTEFPVKSFNWLKQGEKNSQVKLSFTKSMAKLLASLANVFWEKLSIKEQAFLMEVSTSVIDASPFYELTFTKSEECWNVI